MPVAERVVYLEGHGLRLDKGERHRRPCVVIGRGAPEEDDPGTWEASLPFDAFRQSSGAPVTNSPNAARVRERHALQSRKDASSR